jgi:hypothetical protein
MLIVISSYINLNDNHELSLRGSGGSSSPSNYTKSPSSKISNEMSNALIQNYQFVLRPSPNPVIQAYTSDTSVYPGETLGFYVNSTDSYRVKIYRVGWYQDNSNVRLVYVSPALHNAFKQPEPFYDSTTNFVDPRWHTSFSLYIPGNWISGVYFAEFTTEKKDVTYSLFVVKNPKNEGDIVMKLPVNTYQAYNQWGGKSLYEHLSDNRTTSSHIRTTNAAYKVTFERPYAEDNGMGQFLKFDLPLVRFLERNHYDVSYITDVDLHEDGKILNGYKAFISSGHDEYWSYQMRTNLERAKQNGINIIFSGGNDVYWQIRFESSFVGKKDTIIVCYKKRDVDPFNGKNDLLVTVRWRDPPVNMPENSLVGTISDEPWFVRGAFTVANSSNWVYKDTGLKDGDKLPGIIGYEIHYYIANGFQPKNLTILGHSLATNDTNASTFADTVLFTTKSRSLVFSAGSVIWNWGLDDWLYYYPKVKCDNPCVGLDDWLYYYPKVNAYSDVRLQIMMRNIIDRMIERFSDL